MTDRDDLTLTPQGKGEGGVDYVVALKCPKNLEYRRFGFYLYGLLRPIKKSEVDKTLTRKLSMWHRGKVFPYPVFLLYFCVLDNEGVYAWLAEPLIDEGKPRLRHHKDADTHPLGRESLDRIVRQVSAWYDAFYATVIVSK